METIKVHLFELREEERAAQVSGWPSPSTLRLVLTALAEERLRLRNEQKRVSREHRRFCAVAELFDVPHPSEEDVDLEASEEPQLSSHVTTEAGLEAQIDALKQRLVAIA